MTIVRLTHAAVDEDKNGEIILRGRLDPSTIDGLLTDDYQRETMPASSIQKIIDGFKSGSSIPDIDLGMRGHTTKSHSTKESGEIWNLSDPVFIIDGLQRVTAARKFLKEGGTPRLGATVHLGTDYTKEKERFRLLNLERRQLSPNVVIRNLKDDYPAIATLYNMSNDADDFVLRRRVTWTQSKRQSDLITATTFLRIAGVIHFGHGGGSGKSSAYATAMALQRVSEGIGRNTMRANIRTFFDVVDQCWGIRRIEIRANVSYMNSAFLSTLARIFADHTDFWRGDKEERLTIVRPIVVKLKSFPVDDPTIVNLSKSGGASSEVLYNLIIKHINSGKRTQRLTARKSEE